MALLMADFTQSFLAVINPVVGLDTMWRMGVTYVKAYVMCLCVGTLWFGLNAVIGVVTQSERATMISLTARFFGGLLEGVVTFYSSLVIACILGFALYKSADALDIGMHQKTYH